MKKVLIALLFMILGAGIGIGGFYLYNKTSYEKTIIQENKFPKNTKLKINNWETYASYETAEDMYNDYLSSCDKPEFIFNIKLKDKNYTIDLTDCYSHSIKLSDFEDILNKISIEEYMKKDSLEFTLEDKYIYDESKIKEKFSDFLNNTSYEYVEPQNASFDEKNYCVIESINGTKIVEALAVEDFIKAVQEENFSLDLDNEKYFVKAEIQTKDIAEQYKEILSIANWKATYSVSDYIISMKDYMNYVTQNEDGTYTIDTSFMKSAVLALSKTIDNYKAMERTFNTTLDGVITISKGTYNQVMNNAEEIEYLIEKLEKRESLEDREPIWKVKPVASGEEKTYVEIDLSAQHVWYYEDGVLVIEADCVTGTDNTKRETPTGVYYISQMIKGTYLTGPTWRSWVDRWMRITSDGVGLHDAQWRDSDEFGGDTYKTDGSHGCINLPKAFAYELYDKVKYGTMVIVHD